MSSYKTRARDKGNINNDFVKATRSGTSVVNGSSLSASNLQANLPVKTDNALVLQSTKLEISDTNGLQTALDSAVQYQGTLPAPIGALVKISDTTGNVENSNITEADVNNKVSKSGDTMTGNLDMSNNNIDNVNIAKVNTFEPNASIDPLSIGFSADNVSFNAINTTINGLPGQEVAFRITRQGVNYGEIKTQPNIVSISNFGNSAVNLKLEGVNGSLLLDDTNTKLLSNNLDLDINQNTINNVFRANIDRIAVASTTNIDIENDLFLKDNDIKKVGDLNVDTLSVNTLSSITINSDTTFNNLATHNADVNLFSNNILSVGDVKTTSLSSTDFKSNDVDCNCNLDLLGTRNIKNAVSVSTNTISAVAPATTLSITSDLDLNSNDIINVDNLEINTLGKNGAGDITLQDNIDVNNFDLKFVNNIDAQDVKTNTLTAYAPLTEIKLNTNTDLNLNGNNIIGLDLINGIQPSGGLYSESSGFSTSSTTEVNILGQGASSGSLSIPADTFTALSMYSFKASGVLTGGTNDVFTIRAKTLSPGPISVLLGEIMPTLQDNNLIDVAWDIMIDFTIRAIGASGVASLVLSGAFRYTNNSDVVRTFLRTIVLTTGFDTTRDNTLELTFQNDATNPITSFRIDQASFTKWY